MDYRETINPCPACGATADDRKNNRPYAPQGLETCPFCDSKKCCMCNMGDDVECLGCDDD